MARSGPKLTRIATALGVSAATVSNALSGKGRVSAELAEKIRSVAAEIGYVPSQAGRALRTGKSAVIGLVLPDISNPLFPQIAQAIEFAASSAGYGVLIADSRGDVAVQTRAIERLIERGVDGMVIVPRRGTRIADVGCPVAVVDTPSTPGNTVAADHWDGGRQIAEHLVGLGHRRLRSWATIPPPTCRTTGSRASLGHARRRAGGDAVDRTAGAGTRQGLLARARREGGGRRDGLCGRLRLQALRALTELQRAGIHVPEQASVTGFDDLIWSPVVTPALTTIRMDMARIATLAVEALVQAIGAGEAEFPSHGTPVAATISKVPMQLVVRQSTATPPSNVQPAPNVKPPSEGEPQS